MVLLHEVSAEILCEHSKWPAIRLDARRLPKASHQRPHLPAPRINIVDWRVQFVKAVSHTRRQRRMQFRGEAGESKCCPGNAGIPVEHRAAVMT